MTLICSLPQVSGKPIKLVGRGERMEDLEPFYPDRMAGRILGMGDVLSFVEKAQEVVSGKQVFQLSFFLFFTLIQLVSFDSFINDFRCAKKTLKIYRRRS